MLAVKVPLLTRRKHLHLCGSAKFSASDKEIVATIEDYATSHPDVLKSAVKKAGATTLQLNFSLTALSRRPSTIIPVNSIGTAFELNQPVGILQDLQKRIEDPSG
jgi:pyruvate kinase